MLLYLKYAIDRAGSDEQTFFRAAYMWRFGKDANVANDVCQYRLHAIVPRYVEEYIADMQKKQPT